MDPLGLGASIPPPVVSDDAISNQGGGNANSLAAGIAKKEAVSTNTTDRFVPVTVGDGTVSQDGSRIPSGSDSPAPAAPTNDVGSIPGGVNGPHAMGNPYFEPNPVAILSAAIYKFYASSEKAGLMQAKVVNESMLSSAEISKDIAAAQIAAGNEEANKAYAGMVQGAFQMAAGAFSIMSLLKTKSFISKEDGDTIKAAKAEKDIAKTELDNAKTGLDTATKNLKTKETELDAMKLEKTTDSASTDPLTKKTKKEVAELDKKIAAKEKEVERAHDEVKMKHDDMTVAGDKINNLNANINKIEQEATSRATQVAQAFNSAFLGFGNIIGKGMESQAAIKGAAEQATITIEQTEQANINKMGDFASQSYQALQDAMNSMLQMLDKTVDATAQANNMKG